MRTGQRLVVLFSLFLPDIGFRGEVAVCNVTCDLRDEFSNADKAPLADGILGEVSEKALDHIHPGTGRWREMHDHAVDA